MTRKVAKKLKKKGSSVTEQRVYCTTFCNQGHDVTTGRPIGHECYILDPLKLHREAEGDESAFREGSMKKQPVKIVNGKR